MPIVSSKNPEPQWCVGLRVHSYSLSIPCHLRKFTSITRLCDRPNVKRGRERFAGGGEEEDGIYLLSSAQLTRGRILERLFLLDP